MLKVSVASFWLPGEHSGRQCPTIDRKLEWYPTQCRPQQLDDSANTAPEAAFRQMAGQGLALIHWPVKMGTGGRAASLGFKVLG